MYSRQSTLFGVTERSTLCLTLNRVLSPVPPRPRPRPRPHPRPRPRRRVPPSPDPRAVADGPVLRPDPGAPPRPAPPRPSPTPRLRSPRSSRPCVAADPLLHPSLTPRSLPLPLPGLRRDRVSDAPRHTRRPSQARVFQHGVSGRR